jgi:two-component system NarL family sensor kinase
LQLHLEYPGRHPQEQLLYSAARELLANVVQHAEATEVEVALTAAGGELRLVVADDGRGFPSDRPAEALADGHVGLASQRVRIEAVGGTLDITSDGGGTRAEIRMPV